MGAIDDFAAGLSGDLADLDAAFKALADRRRKVKERGNNIAQRWSEFFVTQDQAITAAENALNRISNVPVSASPPSITQRLGLSQVKTTSEK